MTSRCSPVLPGRGSYDVPLAFGNSVEKLRRIPEGLTSSPRTYVRKASWMMFSLIWKVHDYNKHKIDGNFAGGESHAPHYPMASRREVCTANLRSPLFLP